MGLWSDPARARRFDGSGRAAPGTARRLKDWTRRRFALADDDMVVITEVASSIPGFPPRETVVGFWTASGTRHHFRVFKRVEQVLPEDVPPAWLRAALQWDGFDCDCC